MKFFNSIISAFAMYSRIPVPKIKMVRRKQVLRSGIFSAGGRCIGIDDGFMVFLSQINWESTQYYFQR